jgi:hypothetical protein
VTSRIGYYDDDDVDDDEDPDELRERAFTLWRKHGARCNTPTLRLAHEYADDLGFYANGRAIHSALESRGRSRPTLLGRSAQTRCPDPASLCRQRDREARQRKPVGKPAPTRR